MQEEEEEEEGGSSGCILKVPMSRGEFYQNFIRIVKRLPKRS